MTASANPVGLPDIILSRPDFEALDRLVGDLPANIVSLNRWLHYVDGRAEEARRVQLVLPEDADIDQGKVSILSWVGAGLIGLAEGMSLDWPDASGELRRLTPIRVEAA